jgi:hypothetical protein
MQKWIISHSEPNGCATRASSPPVPPPPCARASLPVPPPPEPPLCPHLLRSKLLAELHARRQDPPLRQRRPPQVEPGSSLTDTTTGRSTTVGGGPARRPVLVRAVDLEDAGRRLPRRRSRCGWRMATTDRRLGELQAGGGRWRPTDGLRSLKRLRRHS